MPKKTPDRSQLYSEASGLVRTLLEESDRGAAICAFAFLEDALTTLLVARLADEKMAEEVVKRATMEVKSKIAFLSGLVERPILRDMELIRDIRNAFAHSRSGLTFNSPEIGAKCRSLYTPFMIAEKKDDATPRQLFLVTFAVCLTTLLIVAGLDRLEEARFGLVLDTDMFERLWTEAR